MRLTLLHKTLILIIACGSIGIVRAQELEAISVTCGLEHEELRVLFRQIREQTGLQFAFQPQAVDPYKDITLAKETRTVKQTLDLAFKDTRLGYKKQDKTVMVFEQEGGSSSTQSTPTESNSGSLHYVSGRVLDSKGSAIPGVNILIRGTSEGTVTDAEGKYSLQVTGSDLLLFSFIGFKRFETEVGERTVIDVVLEEETASLEAVTINAGYYEVNERQATGNIAKVTAKDIERQPVTSPVMALQGRMPGVDVAPANGIAGSFASIIVRGRNSISNAFATPLYVVDGIPIDSRPLASDNNVVYQGDGSILQGNVGFDPLSSINPANIESIEVLKDADATAIYGSRGANGVILITTKRGKESEKTNLDFTTYVGVGQTPRFLDLLSTPQYVAVRKEALANDKIPIGSAIDLSVWDTTRYTNWQKTLLGGTSNVVDMQMNLSSGNKYTSFRFGGAYHKERMVEPGDFGFQRISGNLSLGHVSANDKFRANISINYGVTINKLFASAGLVERAIHLPPNAPALYDANGNLNWENGTFNNPLASLRQTDDTRGDNLIINSNLAYEILKGLSVKVNLGYNVLENNSLIKYPLSAVNPTQITNSTTASASFGTTKRNSWIAEPQIIYDFQRQSHRINAVLGITWQDNNSSYQLISAQGYTSDVLLESLKGAAKTTYVTDNNTAYRYMAGFGRIGYSFKDKYLLNLTGRRDGSSRFGADHRWGNFGAVGAGWIFSEEGFFKKWSFLSFGKLRGSLGITGSDQIGDYQYKSTYGYITYGYQDAIGLAPNGLANSNYAWEQTTKVEFALEVGLFKDRIHLQMAEFLNRCSNQLIQYQLPGTTGFSGVIQNLNATVENKGIEISLTTLNIDNRLFKWRSSFNFTLPKNKLVSYPGLEQSPDASKYIVGEPLNIVKLYNYLGVDPKTGLYQVRDVDGNGVYDFKDKTYVQTIGRKSYGGLNNTLSYKEIELSFFFQFAIQNALTSVFETPGLTNANFRAAVFDNYWRKEGDVSLYSKATTSYIDSFGAGYSNQSNAAVTNSSFVRLKTLSLSYTIPEVLLRKSHLQAAKIYMQGQNLFTASKAVTLDPEVGIYGLPPLRMITIGLEIKI